MSADAWYDCPKCFSGLDGKTRDAVALLKEKGFGIRRPERMLGGTMREDSEVFFNPEKRVFVVSAHWSCSKCGYTHKIEVAEDVKED